jgi:hypothetical protein
MRQPAAIPTELRDVVSKLRRSAELRVCHDKVPHRRRATPARDRSRCKPDAPPAGCLRVSAQVSIWSTTVIWRIGEQRHTSTDSLHRLWKVALSFTLHRLNHLTNSVELCPQLAYSCSQHFIQPEGSLVYPDGVWGTLNITEAD